MNNGDLGDLRAEIDKINEELLDVLSRRMAVVEKILESKKKSGKKVRDRKREMKVIEKTRELAEEKGLDPDFAEDVMRLVISRSVAEEREKVGEPSMWGKIQKIFSGNPAQLKVARVLYKYGLRVKENGDVVCGDIRVPAVQIGKEAGVDRRAVDATAETIVKDDDLRELFSNLRPIPYLKAVAQQLNLGVIEIIPSDASRSGIISEVTNVISNHKLSIRQSVADDPYFAAQPKLTIITGEPVSGAIIEELRELPSVESVIVY